MRREGRYHRVLKARLEDAGVEICPACTATPEPATRPSPSPTVDVRGCRRRCGSRAIGLSEGDWRSSDTEALGIDATSRSIHVPRTPRAKPACAVPGATQPVRRHELPERTVATDEILKPLLRTYYGFEVLIVEAGASASSAGRMFWEMPTQVHSKDLQLRPNQPTIVH